MAGKHALVFGASGITGWAIVNQLLNDYPNADQFSKITAVTNRPLPASFARWPLCPKLQVISGIDLLKGDLEELQKTLRAEIPSVDKTNYLFFNCKNPYF